VKHISANRSISEVSPQSQNPESRPIAKSQQPDPRLFSNRVNDETPLCAQGTRLSVRSQDTIGRVAAKTACRIVMFIVMSQEVPRLEKSSGYEAST
jgi:hypothetical protein